MARLARFYGFSRSDLRALSVNEMNEYVIAMDKIEAREMLLSIKAAFFPRQDESERKKVFAYYKRASEVEEKEMDSIEVAKALGFI